MYEIKKLEGSKYEIRIVKEKAEVNEIKKAVITNLKKTIKKLRKSNNYSSKLQ